MQYKRDDIHRVKVGLMGFVVKQAHTYKCAYTAAKQTHNKQSSFAYTPFMFYGAPLIYAHRRKEY